ncbi:MAG: hypothetical protein ABSH14_09020 [Verrucomicrobiia bacterium]|jgi:hypothetical protein
MNAARFFSRRVFGILVLIAGFLLFFGVMTQCSWDGITTFYVAMFTLGLCGLPTTLIGLFISGSVCKLLRVPEATTYWIEVIAIAACFVLQCLYIAGRTQPSDDA